MGAPSPLYEAIGSLVRRARIEQTISPAALARYLNKPVSFIEAIEEGTQGVTVLVLYALADALNCKATDLLPQREHVTMPGNARNVNIAVEKLLSEALVEDPAECKRWVIGLIHDALIVNIEQGKQQSKKRKGA